MNSYYFSEKNSGLVFSLHTWIESTGGQICYLAETKFFFSCLVLKHNRKKQKNNNKKGNHQCIRNFFLALFCFCLLTESQGLSSWFVYNAFNKHIKLVSAASHRSLWCVGTNTKCLVENKNLGLTFNWVFWGTQQSHQHLFLSCWKALRNKISWQHRLWQYLKSL